MSNRELKAWAYISGDLRYDTEGAMLFDDKGNHIADIRGYGRVGSSGQDQIGKAIVDAWNTRTTPDINEVLDVVLNKLVKTMIRQNHYEYISIDDIQHIINNLKENHG